MRKLLFVITLASALFGQSNYPGSLDTDASLYVTADNVQTTLTSPMQASDSVAIVQSSAGFAANMIATVCDAAASNNSSRCTLWEHMLVTNVAGNVLTVTRGVAGTTALAHSAGKFVSVLIDAAHQKSLKSAVIALETALGPGMANVPTSPLVSAASYAFSPQSPGGSLVPGNNTITMSPVPKGVNGTDAGHGLYVSGGVGTAEVCTITGGTGTSGQTSGQVIINCANTHSGAWTVQSATAGWQEAAQAVGANGSVYFPSGTYTLRGSFTVPFNGQTYFGDSPDVVTITVPNASGFQRFAIVGAKSDITFRNLGFFGNFVNQTYVSGWNSAIDGGDLVGVSPSTRLKVLGCKFRGFGDLAGTSYSQVISLYGAHDCQIRDSLFVSNMATEIVLNGTLGCAVVNNTFGSPNLSDSQAQTNWWDTYSGGFGIEVEGGSNFFIEGNRMFGVARQINGSGTVVAYGSLVGFSAGGPVQTSFAKVQNNEFHGMSNGRGTISVSSGSTTVTGTNTGFASLDASPPNGRWMLIEGDATLHRITGYTSATSITISPASNVTGSAQRYQIAQSGDSFGFGNITYLSATGNTCEYSGDNCFDIAGNTAGFVTNNAIFAANRAAYAQNDGLYIGGSVSSLVVSGNSFVANGQQGQAGHRGAIYMSPTNEGSEAAQLIWLVTFDGNRFDDLQGINGTQLYGIQAELGQTAKLLGITISPSNIWYCYTCAPGSGLFDTSVITPSVQATSFSVQATVDFPYSVQAVPQAGVSVADAATIVWPVTGNFIITGSGTTVTAVTMTGVPAWSSGTFRTTGGAITFTATGGIGSAGTTTANKLYTWLYDGGSLYIQGPGF
jgi:hypothetical protein